MASISSENGFQRMCNIHSIFKINVVDMLLETVNNNIEGISGSLTPPLISYIFYSFTFLDLSTCDSYYPTI